MRSSRLFVLFFTGLLCALVLLFLFVSPVRIKVPSASAMQVSLGGTPVTVTVARTPAEWELGLSGRTSLAPYTGMLFLFDKPDIWGIWMKDMQFPIDVMWFDLDGKLIFMQEDFLPSSYPEVVNPTSPASMVLEVPAGFVAEHQIHVGTTLVLPKVSSGK